jgi:hypothetical protein
MRFDPLLQLGGLLRDPAQGNVKRDARVMARLAHPQAGKAVTEEAKPNLHNMERFRPLLQVASELDFRAGNQVQVMANALETLFNVRAELGRKVMGTVAYLYLHSA